MAQIAVNVCRGNSILTHRGCDLIKALHNVPNCIDPLHSCLLLFIYKDKSAWIQPNPQGGCKAGIGRRSEARGSPYGGSRHRRADRDCAAVRALCAQ